MDLYDVITGHHDDLRKMFDRYGNAESDGAKLGLLGGIRQHLVAHSDAEEEIVYSHLRSLGDLDEEIAEGIEEHHVADVLLAELDGLEPSDEAFGAKLEVLEENVRHHLEEEEDELFAEMRKRLDADTSSDLAERYQRRFQELLLEQRTVADLRDDAAEADIEGRSDMTKAQLIDALITNS